MAALRTHGLKSLRAKIAIPFALLVILAVLAPGLIAVHQTVKTLTASAEERQLLAAQTAANHLSHLLQDQIATVQGIAQEESLQEMAPARMDADIRKVRRHEKTFTSLIVIDPEGKIVSFVDKPWNVGKSLAQREYFQIALHQGRTYISDSILTLDKTITVAVAAPIRNDRGQIVGVLAGTFDVHHQNFNEAILNTKIGAAGYAYLVDQKGIVITHPEAKRALEQENFAHYGVVREILAGKSGVGLYNFEGIEMLAAYAPVEPSGWGVIVQQPLAAANAPAITLRHLMLTAVLVSIVLAVFLGVLIAHRISTPLTRLESSALTIATGNLEEPVPALGQDEIGRLAGTFDEMRLSLKESRGRLETANETFRVMLDATPATVLLLDPEGIVLAGNEMAAARLGKTVQEIMGTCIYSHLPPEVAATRKARFEEMKRSGRPVHFEDRRNNFHFDNYIHPIFTPTGDLAGVAVLAVDITARQQAEAALRQSERELSIRNRITQVFLTIPDDEMYGEVLQIILEDTGSKVGVFGYLDEEGTMVCPSMSREVWDQCQIPEKTIRFPRVTWGDSIWGRAVREKKSLYSNQPGKVPQGHLPINCVLVTPVIFRGEVIGHFEVANKDAGYGEPDKERLETITDFIAPILCARLHRDREEQARQRTEAALRESEERFRTIYENAPVLIDGFDKNGRCTLWNRECEKVFGWTMEEINSHDEPLALFYPDPDVRRKVIDTVTSQPDKIFREWRPRTRDGKEVSTLWANFQLPDGMVINIGYDITERQRAEESRRQSEERFRAAFEFGPMGMALSSAGGRLFHVNRAFGEMLGYSEVELLNLSFQDITYPEDLESSFVEWGRLLAGEAAHFEKETRYLNRQGETIWASVSTALLRYADGSPNFFITQITDITAHKRAEEALRQSEESFRTLYHLTPVMLHSIDSRARLLRVSDYWLNHLGYEREEVLGRPSSDFMTPESRDRLFKTHLPEFLKTGLVQDLEFQFVKKNGERIDVLLSSVAQKDEKGEFIQSMTVVVDITTRKRAEAALQASEALLREAQRIAHIGSWSMNLTDNIIRWSDEMYNIYGVTKGEFLPTVASLLQLLHPDDRPLLERWIEQAIADIKPEELDFRIILPDGAVRYIRGQGDLITDRAGQPERIAGTAQDITERKQAEAERDRLFNLSIDMLCIAGLDGYFKQLNPAWEKVLGWTDQELLAKPWLDFVHPEDRAATMAAGAQLAAGETVYDFENRYQCRDGSYRWFSWNAFPLREEGLIFCVARDVTARKQAEAALRESEDRLRLAVAASGTGLWDLDLRTNQVYFSPEWKKQLGYEEHEISPLFEEWEGRLHPEDHDRAVSTVQAYVNNPWPDYEMECRMRHKDGSYRWILARASLFFDQTGKPYRMMGSHLDITERKRFEEALRTSEEIFHNLFNNTEVAMFRSRLDGSETLNANEKFLELVGRTREEVVGKPSVVYWVDPRRREEMVRRLKDHGRVVDLEFQMLRNDGEVRDCLTSLNLYPEEGLLDGSILDITERKQAEAALRESESRYRELVESMSSGVAIYEPRDQGRAFFFKDFNRGGERIEGIKREEVIGKDVTEVFPGVKEFGLLEVFQRVWRTGTPEHFPLGLYRDDRNVGWRENYVYKLPSGELVAVYDDVTVRKEAEERLKNQMHFVSTLLDTIPSPVFYKDTSGRYLGCNRAFEEFFSKTREEIIGKGVYDMGPPEIAAEYAKMDQELFDHPGRQMYEWLVRAADGTTREAIFNKATFSDAAGKVAGLIGTIMDITERKQAEQEIIRQSDQLRALAARLAEVEETERQHLARELHDQVGQNLSALGVDLNLLQVLLPGEAGDQLRSRLADSAALLDQTVALVRDLMVELRPPVLDEYGLVEALRWYGARFSQRMGIAVDMEGEDFDPRLAPEIEISLFRIAQEALTNVAKHARATRVRVAGEVDNGKVRLTIADNGVGFDAARRGQPEGGHGWGLMNMTERALAAGGHCQIESQPGQGARVVVEVPR